MSCPRIRDCFKIFCVREVVLPTASLRTPVVMMSEGDAQGTDLLRRLRHLSDDLLSSGGRDRRVAVSLEANLVLLAVRDHQRNVLVTKRQATDASGVGSVSLLRFPACVCRRRHTGVPHGCVRFVEHCCGCRGCASVRVCVFVSSHEYIPVQELAGLDAAAREERVMAEARQERIADLLNFTYSEAARKLLDAEHEVDHGAVLVHWRVCGCGRRICLSLTYSVRYSGASGVAARRARIAYRTRA